MRGGVSVGMAARIGRQPQSRLGGVAKSPQTGPGRRNSPGRTQVPLSNDRDTVGMAMAGAQVGKRPTDEGDDPARVPPAGPARLLAELLPTATTVSLAEHRRRYPVPPRPGRGANEALITEIERSGLSGRGGAAFPAGAKLRAVAARPGPAVVVANGAEGEPASGKDRLLLRRLPHLVLDGALIAAAAAGADRVIVAVDRANTSAVDAMTRAVAERRGQGETTVAAEVAAVPPATSRASPPPSSIGSTGVRPSRPTGRLRR